ncbi:MAG: glycosyltransferase family 39 protein, partial [Planctomycetota bacterium]
VWRDAVANSPHADYPLLLPCTIARLWRYAGAAGQVAPAAVALLFPLTTVALLVAVLRSLRGPLAGLLAGAALLACPAFVATAPMQYADLVLAFFVLGTLAVLAVHDHHGRPGVRLAVLAGACLGFAVWTKNEGALFAIVLLLARAVAVRSHGWRCTRRELGALLLGAAPGIAAWWSVKLLVAPPNDLVAQVAAGKAADRIADPARWLEIARAFATELWNLGPAMLAVVLVWACLHRQRRLRLPLAVAALVLAGDALVYLMASHNLSWHLATSLQRLLLQVLPAVLLGVFAATRAAAPRTTTSSSP